MFLGHAVIAQDQLGNGETAAFAISILQQINVEVKETQALVLVPTRELTQQVSSPLTRYYLLLCPALENIQGNYVWH